MALDYNINDSVLEELVKSGIFSSKDDARRNLEMTKRKEILSKVKVSTVKDIRNGKEYLRYRAYVYDATGKRSAIVKRDRQELEDAVVAFYLRIEKKQAAAPSFEEVYKEWCDYIHIKRKHNANTVAKYKMDFERFFSGKSFIRTPINQITDLQIDEFFLDCITTYENRDGEIGLEYKPFTKLYGYVEGTFNYAFRKRLITDNPMMRLSRLEFASACKDKRIKTAETELISDEHFELIMRTIHNRMEKEKYSSYYPLYALELTALIGTRAGELAVLRWDDIQERIINGEKRKVLIISKSDNYNRLTKEWTISSTKTGKWRVIPVDDAIEAVLRKIKATQVRNNQLSEWLFPHPEFGWYHSTMISSCLKALCLSLGLDRTYGVHAFRKTLNSYLRSNNVSAMACASLLGNTPEVNDEYYSYDTTGLDDKRIELERVHQRVLAFG